MTYHCDKLCSNACCLYLQYALTYYDTLGNDCEAFDICRVCACKKLVDDPAKLAELGAMAMRARGVTDSLMGDDWYVLPLPGDNTIDVMIIDPDGLDHDRLIQMPAFRTLLARIMATPANASSREQVEKMVRGEP